MFEGRTLLIATKHEKERVIAPILEKELGVKCFVAENFDTDELGTFTGEIERADNPLETARKKCLAGMQLMNCDLAIASEGSFGPHPFVFFVPADDEILLFIDKKNGLEIISRELSTETNFNAEVIKNEKELRDFANAALFPSHALIARKSKDDYSKIHKGIQDWESLSAICSNYFMQQGSVYIETDMRALYNPTRMKLIETVAAKLAQRINTNCPNCHTPGFGITSSKKGLPCELCHLPTRSTLCHVLTCQRCDYTKLHMFPNEKQFENPAYCDVCNP